MDTSDMKEKPTPPPPSKDKMAAIAEKLGASKLSLAGEPEKKEDPVATPPKEPVVLPSGMGQFNPEGFLNTQGPQQVAERIPLDDKKLIEQLHRHQNFDDLAKAMGTHKWEVMDRIHQLLHEKETYKKARQELRLK